MARGGKRPGSGRPKGFAAAEAERFKNYLAARLAEEWEPVVTKMLDQAKRGDSMARKELFDRAYGKPKEMIEQIVSQKILIIDE